MVGREWCSGQYSSPMPTGNQSLFMWQPFSQEKQVFIRINWTQLPPSWFLPPFRFGLRHVVALVVIGAGPAWTNHETVGRTA